MPKNSSDRYTGPTENIQGDLEAPASAVASGSSSFWRQIIAPACGDTDPNEWVTDRERPVVPPRLASLCATCPGRAECLAWAIVTRSAGYWAGTTTADREAMAAGGNTSLGFADLLQEAERARRAEPLHAPGWGSAQWYRKRGCRCDECLAASAARRARQRATVDAHK